MAGESAWKRASRWECIHACAADSALYKYGCSDAAPHIDIPCCMLSQAIKSILVSPSWEASAETLGAQQCLAPSRMRSGGRGTRQSSRRSRP